MINHIRARVTLYTNYVLEIPAIIASQPYRNSLRFINAPCMLGEPGKNSISLKSSPFPITAPTRSSNMSVPVCMYSWSEFRAQSPISNSSHNKHSRTPPHTIFKQSQSME